MTRLENLIEFIEEKLELDYGYIPKSKLDDETKVDEYIIDIKEEFDTMIENEWIVEDSLEEIKIILESLNDI